MTTTTTNIESAITEIVMSQMRNSGAAMVQRLQKELKRRKVTLDAAAMNSFRIEIKNPSTGLYVLELYFFEYLRFSEIWRTQYKGLPNVDAIAQWLQSRNIPLVDSKGKRQNATPAKTKAVAYAIAKHKSQNPAKKKVKAWHAKTVFKGAYSIFLDLVDNLSDEQIKFFKEAAKPNA